MMDLGQYGWILAIALRWMHIGGAAIAVGGTAGMLLAVWPGTRLLEEGLRESVLEMIDRRFSTALYVAIGFLAVSGLYQWILFANAYARAGAVAQGLVLAKGVVIVVFFVMVWVEAMGIWGGPVRKRLVWRLAVASLILMLGGALRYVRLEYGGG